MTKKDEARARLERHLGFAWDAGTKGGKDGINHGMKLADAFAQAHTDAALADPLALLEVIAKKGDDIIWRGLQVRCIPETGYFLYFRPVDNLVNLILLSRAEAEALLKGDAE